MFILGKVKKGKRGSRQGNIDGKQKKQKENKKDKTHNYQTMSFLPNTGVDINLSHEWKQKNRKRSDYKIRLKYSENNGKR